MAAGEAGTGIYQTVKNFPLFQRQGLAWPVPAAAGCSLYLLEMVAMPPLEVTATLST